MTTSSLIANRSARNGLKAVYARVEEVADDFFVKPDRRGNIPHDVALYWDENCQREAWRWPWGTKGRPHQGRPVGVFKGMMCALRWLEPKGSRAVVNHASMVCL